MFCLSNFTHNKFIIKSIAEIFLSRENNVVATIEAVLFKTVLRVNMQ